MNPSNEGYALKEKVAELSAALLSKHPTMPVLLNEIHKTIRQYPEQMTLLEESEIQTLVSGLIQQTKVEFATTAIKVGKEKSVAAKIKSAGADAF